MTDAARLQFIVFFSVVVSAWVGMHAYVAWRLAAVAPRPAAIALWALLGAGALLWPVVTYVTRQVTSEAPLAGLRQGLWTYFGLFSVAVVLVLARDALLGIGAALARALDAPVEPTKRRAFEVASAAVVAGATGIVGVAGWRGATRLAPVVAVDVPIPGLDPRLDGLKIAQISDIHIGQPLTKSELAAIVARTNEIGADLIAVTGDLVDGRVQVYADDTAPVGDLRAPLGVFFVTGNHEYYSGTKPWERLLKERGLDVLTNEHRVLTHNGAPFVLGGVTDYTAGRFVPEDASSPARAFASAPEGLLRVLLAHQPKSVVEAAEQGVHLQLSGHTHGGQYWPFTTMIDWFHPVTSGLSRFRDTLVYVSRGTGVWGPRLRVGAPNEITALTLRAA
mgnify:CR=1 FL=1